MGALAACHHAPTPQEQAEKDARAVAYVKAAQNHFPPPQPIHPQAMTASELTAKEMLRQQCAFRADSAPGNVVLVVTARRAVLKLDDGLVVLASDPGGPALINGAWQHYVGKAYSLHIEPMADPVVGGALRARARLRDEHDRVVYEQTGALTCVS